MARLSLFLFYILVSTVFISCKEERIVSGDVLISGVNIVNTISGEVIHNQNVLIQNDRVVAILEASEIVHFDVEVTLEAKSKFLVPGLWDMHAHPDDPEVWRMNPTTSEKDRLMPLFVVNGVTGIRDMGGALDMVKRWRDLYKADSLLAPRIFAGGPLLDGPNPMWDGSVGIDGPSQVPMVVDSLIGAGVDFLKVYSLLPRETYMELSRYAKEIDFPFVGHVPFTVKPSEAVMTGMKSQEHLLEILKECSSELPNDFVQKLKRLPNGVSRSVKVNNFRMATFDQKKADSLYTLFADTQTWHCPTLSMWYKNAWFEDELPKDSVYLPLLPKYLQRYWTPAHNDHLQNRGYQEYLKMKQQLYLLYLNMVNQMHKKGVLMLAGTDTGANPLCFPGKGIHTELKAFVDAGLSPFEALKTATIHPAMFFGISKDYGSVEVGKVADLLILDDNPLTDISNISKIQTVLRDGRPITKNQIIAIQDSIKKLNLK